LPWWLDVVGGGWLTALMVTTTCARSVDLPTDHPGFSDPAYRARRDAIAAVGAAYEPGDPIPDVVYAPEEDALWKLVSDELAIKHEKYAVRAYREATARLALPHDRVPQLREVDARLAQRTGFHVRPVPGLVPTRVFYGSLADRTFCSTQYVRHHSVPFYTPEPDVVHEIVGHCNMLADPAFADLYELAGHASLRAESDGALEFFSRVFWFSLEFGIVWEDAELRAYGAGLLSSFGELDVFRTVEVRPFDVRAMGTTAYDITVYQPLLFAARSLQHVIDELGGFLSSYDDDAYQRLIAA
jgi:phenylalanine-4-hydroxylase